MNSLVTVLAGFGVALAIQPVIDAVLRVGDAFDDRRDLRLEYLNYDGTFQQKLNVFGDDEIQATWAVEISRNIGGESVWICGGGGRGIYDGTPQMFSVNDFTGADCPDLRRGDLVRAHWEFVDDNLTLRGVSARLVIDEKLMGVP